MLLDDGDAMATRLVTRCDLSWLRPPTSAYGGHQHSFGSAKWHELGAGADVPEQSSASVSVLCSLLYCAVTSPVCAPEERQLLLGWCWAHTHFPPMLHALHSLFVGHVTLRPKQRLAIAVGAHALVTRLTPASGHDDAVPAEHAHRAPPPALTLTLTLTPPQP